MTATAQNRRDLAAESEQERQERVRALRQRAKALDVPTECAAQVWATSTAGCLIHLCEYGQDEDKNQLQRHYWNVINVYQETLLNESKALGASVANGESSKASYEDDSEAYENWCNQARARARDMRAHLIDLQNSVRTRANIPAIVSHILDTDANQSNWKAYKHMFPQLRLTLDGLSRFFRNTKT